VFVCVDIFIYISTVQPGLGRVPTSGGSMAGVVCVGSQTHSWYCNNFPLPMIMPACKAEKGGVSQRQAGISKGGGCFLCCFKLDEDIQGFNATSMCMRKDLTGLSALS
jgi:hypothetical protein